MRFRWPFMAKSRYEREIKLISDSAAGAIQIEYQRAMVDGKAQVHAWARDAAAKFFYIDNHRAKGAAITAFEQAEHQFGPAPLALSDVLYAPANVEEAIDAVTGS